MASPLLHKSHKHKSAVVGGVIRMKTSSERTRAEVSRRNLTSHMNQTKWAKVLPRLDPKLVQIRLKWLFASSPGNWSNQYLLPVDGYFEEPRRGPVPFREIEWLELRTEDLGGLEATLNDMNVPFSKEDDCLKIWGYSSAGVDFV